MDFHQRECVGGVPYSSNDMRMTADKYQCTVVDNGKLSSWEGWSYRTAQK